MKSTSSAAKQAGRQGSENALPAQQNQPLSGRGLETSTREVGANPSDLETRERLSAALHDATRSALGMPGTPDLFTEWLKRHGLVLVLAPKETR